MYRPSTIPDSIEAGLNESLSHSKLYLKTVYTEGGDNDDIIIFNLNSLISKYIDIVNRDYVKTVELTEQEYTRYRFNPKLFCSETYETAELWSSLLLINNMISQMDFDKKTIKMFTPQITDFIDEMFVLEENNINENTQYVNDIIKNA